MESFLRRKFYVIHHQHDMNSTRLSHIAPNNFPLFHILCIPFDGPIQLSRRENVLLNHCLPNLHIHNFFSNPRNFFKYLRCKILDRHMHNIYSFCIVYVYPYYPQAISFSSKIPKALSHTQLALVLHRDNVEGPFLPWLTYIFLSYMGLASYYLSACPQKGFVGCLYPLNTFLRQRKTLQSEISDREQYTLNQLCSPSKAQKPIAQVSNSTHKLINQGQTVINKNPLASERYPKIPKRQWFFYKLSGP